MGRPIKTGLSYFPKDVDFYNDYKIMDLLEKYGPVGVTIYEVLLTEIYKNGYYLAEPIDRISTKIVRIIGAKWVQKRLVSQVILDCGELGLFETTLLQHGVITSVGIQRRFAIVTSRNKVNKEKYWLIDDSGQPLLSAPLDGISATEKPISATETHKNDAEIPQKESKENKRKLNKISRESQHVPDPALNAALNGYIEFREQAGKPMTERGIRLLLDELEKLSSNPQEQAAILDQSTKNGWIGVYELSAKSKTPGKTAAGKGNKFCNFEQRDTDYDAMVAAETRKMIEESGEGE
ncbi:DUF4373 domain-containing protein [Clostridium sp. OF09-36]|uniref:DUF4373 domain-containing protein n=1 Tax=Clostridium sp. OF09-36 TaxID=2292310 RepID=UPI000E4BAE6A|nr:DUF4373 domain-containing protein [Clostridium sp. OF09-36]RHV86280.1 DUF4373 domain-containing protein [Clostridium sp. OF09-36]